MHILMSSGRVFQWVIAFTEEDDNPKEEWRNQTTKSLVDDVVNLTETVEWSTQNHEVWKGPNHIQLYKSYINSKKKGVWSLTPSISNSDDTPSKHHKK